MKFKETILKSVAMIFIIGLFFTFKSNITFASVTLVATDVTLTSVTLWSNNLTPNSFYKFEVSSIAGTKSLQINADTTGYAEARFVNLSPNLHYTGTVKKYDTTAQSFLTTDMGTVSFGTFGPLSISNDPSYDFGTKNVGTSTDHTFTIQNTSSTDTIASMTATSLAPFYFKNGIYPGTGGTCSTTLSMHASCTVVISYVPTLAKSYDGSFSISYFYGSSNNVTYARELKGAATLPTSGATHTAPGLPGIPTLPLNTQTTQTTTTTVESQTTGNQLIPCGIERYREGTKIDNVDVGGTVKDYCTFKDLLTLINTVINFILFKLAIPIAAIMFCYVGFLMVTSGGSSESRDVAKRVGGNVVKGLILAAASYIIVKAVLVALGFDGSWIGF